MLFLCYNVAVIKEDNEWFMRTRTTPGRSSKCLGARNRLRRLRRFVRKEKDAGSGRHLAGLFCSVLPESCSQEAPFSAMSLRSSRTIRYVRVPISNRKSTTMKLLALHISVMANLSDSFVPKKIDARSIMKKYLNP
ncbi:hypothetical protein D3C74_260980 [compost metagenome]